MDIRKVLKRLTLWFSRKSYLPLILVGGALVLILYFDEDTSMKRNIESDHIIADLKKQIEIENDSAEYYRKKRESLAAGKEELEHIAREQYHMQRLTEDVFIIEEPENQ